MKISHNEYILLNVPVRAVARPESKEDMSFFR